MDVHFLLAAQALVTDDETKVWCVVPAGRRDFIPIRQFQDADDARIEFRLFGEIAFIRRTGIDDGGVIDAVLRGGDDFFECSKEN